MRRWESHSDRAVLPTSISAVQTTPANGVTGHGKFCRAIPYTPPESMAATPVSIDWSICHVTAGGRALDESCRTLGASSTVTSHPLGSSSASSSACGFGLKEHTLP